MYKKQFYTILHNSGVLTTVCHLSGTCDVELFGWPGFAQVTRVSVVTLAT
jgi:hypothetical protein